MANLIDCSCERCNKNFSVLSNYNKVPRTCSDECRKAAGLSSKQDCKIVERPCLMCGSAIAKSRRIDSKYCSAKCCHKAQTATAKSRQKEARKAFILAAIPNKDCAMCSSRFFAASHQTVYCSKYCSQKAARVGVRVRRLRQKSYGVAKCVTCGQEFTMKSPSAKYCSTRCLQNVAHKKYIAKNLNTVFTCETCRKEFMAYIPAKQDKNVNYFRRTCSRTCQNEMQRKRFQTTVTI